MKNFTQEELDTLLKNAEKEFGLFLAKSEKEYSASLTKSEEEEKKEEEKKEDEKQAEEAQADSQEEKKDEEEKPASEEIKEESQAEPKADVCDYDEEDMEELHKLYDGMSKAELDAHRNLLNKCWAKYEAPIEKCGDIEEIKKSETTSSEQELLKSELSTVKTENETLKKNMEQLVVALEKFVAQKAPARKAVTNIEFIAKSETLENEKTLTKSEITKVLTSKASDPSLSKSDREAINKYYATNATDVNLVKHLLK